LRDYPFGGDRVSPCCNLDAAALKKPQELGERLLRAEVSAKGESFPAPTQNNILRAESLPGVDTLEILIMPDLTRNDTELHTIVE